MTLYNVYLVYTIISIFYYCWSNYVSPNFSNRYHTSWYRVSEYFHFHWLHCATTLTVFTPVLCFHMASFNYGTKGVRDVDPACRCFQSNIMPDSIFSVNIAQSVTCFFVFCFMCVKEWYSGLLLFAEIGCLVLSLLH